MVEVRLACAGPVDVLGCVDRPGLATTPDPAVAELLATVPPPVLSRLPQLWFEWDEGGGTPLVWWGLAPETAELDATLAWPEMAERIAGATAPPGARWDGLARITRALRGRGRMLGTGWLSPRGASRLRVYVEIPRGELRGFLGDIGWAGDLDAVTRWWARAIPPLEPGFLQLEVDDRVGAYLGLEARQTRQGLPNRPWIAAWLAALCHTGLADAERTDALLRWDGPLAVGLDGTGTVGPVLRSFHIKLAFAVGRPPEAKAYLGFTTAAALRRRPAA